MTKITTDDLLCFENSFERLRTYVEGENFKGYDPYDTLNSKIKLKYFGRLIPILALQFQKRNPINIRPLLGIQKEHNPKGLGLFLHSYAKLQKEFPEKNYTKQLDGLFDALKKTSTKGYSGYCWGYNFDWASSGKYIQAYSPNIVVTAFVAKGIFEYYHLTENAEALDILKSIGLFILKDLPKTETEDGLCFSYTTLGIDICYNASLLAASVLAQLYSITKDEQLKIIAMKAVDFVIAKQHADGHWNYSMDELGKERIQIDFHQGYIIDCIDDVIIHCSIKNEKFSEAIKKGTAYYMKEQFFRNGQSKWRLPKIYPVEIHNQSQGIITFLRMRNLNSEYLTFSQTIAKWTIEKMQDKKGFFYYRKLKTHTNKIPFMRWSQAWMFVALTELLISLKNEK
ncbi:MAG: hypothetical protein ACK50L_10035 [Bacteroidota bacterium]|jgi:hypothetical protein